jgi:hypothetical protein
MQKKKAPAGEFDGYDYSDSTGQRNKGSLKKRINDPGVP